MLSLKGGALILYPTYKEYAEFCWGFMTADLPWANSFFGGVFGQDGDLTPFPFKVFFTNLNIGSTYFLALTVICLLVAISFLVGRLCDLQ